MKNPPTSCVKTTIVRLIASLLLALLVVTAGARGQVMAINGMVVSSAPMAMPSRT